MAVLRRMRTIVPVTWLVAMVSWSCAAEDNLLRNAGFETLDGSMPAQWNLFVQSEPGAEGRLDTQAFTEGAHAAYLQNPGSYAKDPCNNWSQNVSEGVAGKTLVAGGSIRTEGAAAAAIWVQCWRKDPWGVLRVASTADAMPVRGDQDWTPVAIKLSVPADSDFVVVRCVIRGPGRAWFDDLRLVEAGGEPAPAQMKSAAVPPPPPPSAAPMDTAAALERETAAMAKTIASLRDTNEALRRDLAGMREDIAALRERLVAQQPPAATPRKNVPPLVPHEQIEEESRP